eukprot:UN25706
MWRKIYEESNMNPDGHPVVITDDIHKKCVRDEHNLVRDEHNINFIHIPKTAGESINRALQIPKNHNEVWLRDKSVFAQDNIVISVVRNPYDRMFSWFKFCRHGWFDGQQMMRPGPVVQCDNAVLREASKQGFSDWIEWVILESEWKNVLSKKYIMKPMVNYL